MRSLSALLATALLMAMTNIQGTQAYSSCVCMSDAIKGKAAGDIIEPATADACRMYMATAPVHFNNKNGRCESDPYVEIDGPTWWGNCNKMMGAMSGQCN
jgi:hypothetical protein